KQVDIRELMNTRIPAVLRLVRNRDEPALRCDRRRLPPQRRKLDLVHAIAPRIPLRERGLVQAIGELQSIELTAGELAHGIELAFDGFQYLIRQPASEILAQERIVSILITEAGRRLHEERSHH